MGVKGESERDPSDAGGRADNRRARYGGKRGEVFGIFARQMKRLRRKMKEQGVQGLVHANEVNENRIWFYLFLCPF